METKLERISQLSRENPNMVFTSIGHLINKEMLKSCHEEMDEDKAVGIDGITKEEYSRNLDQNLESLVERIKKKSYKPKPARLVEIPKDNGKMRPLSIYSYEDKLVQEALRRLLEAVFEPCLYDEMIGFRPNRNCHKAIQKLNTMLERKPVSQSTRDSKVKQFLKDNVWNILGTGLAAFITLVGTMNLVISKSFSVSCASFYGIDGKYFSGTEMFENKLIFVLCAFFLFAYPFIFSYISEKINSKIYVILMFLFTVCILFIQNVLYTINLIEIIPWTWLRQIVDNYVTIIVLLIADIMIAYFIIIRNFFWKNRKYNIVEKMVLSIVLLLYVMNVATGIAIKMDYEISDKKSYEVIEQNRAIVSNYDGKFVVMDCEIQGETIVLKKGTYSLEEMTGVSITYHKYEKVICE